jgi:ATPase subunit of ABC transporter with duplicated ATPase domains
VPAPELVAARAGWRCSYLDEPPNNLDPKNVGLARQLGSEHQGALLVVSHEERFRSHCDINRKLNLTD